MSPGRLLLLFTVAVALLSGGCSGSQLLAQRFAPDPPPAPGLPGLTGGEAERDGSALIGPVKLGNEFAWRHNAPDDGTDLILASDPPPGDSTSWAYYQFPQAGGPPVALTVNATYYDPTPHEQTPEEGYWIAYADYAKGGWQFSGPYRQAGARVFIPPEAEPLSPGGFHYALVLTWGGRFARLHSIELGYDDGPGYEEYWLAAPPGEATGNRNDIELDSGGQPQIAYLRQQAMPMMEEGRVRVAAYDGVDWTIQEVETTFEVSRLQFATGAGGRRALLLVEETPGGTVLWLYYDGGGGDFSDTHQLTATMHGEVEPAITFVNKDDIAAGELNMAVAVWAEDAGGGNVTTFFRTYEGTTLSAVEQMYALNTTRVGRLSVSTRADSSALACVANNAGGWRLYVGTLAITAPPPRWDFGSVTSWICPEEVEIYNEGCPDFTVTELSGGDYVGAFRTESGDVTLARWDGANWQSTDRDRHPITITHRLRLAAYSDNQVGIPGTYGNMSPVLQKGEVGLPGSAWHTYYLGDQPLSCFMPSLTVGDDDATHLAAIDPTRFTLTYLRRDPDGTVTSTEVDNGAMGRAFVYPGAMPVVVGDHLHVFYIDLSHLWLMHAENVGGEWIRENEVVSKEGWTFYLAGAGYLEDENLVYALYLDLLNMRMMAASATPTLGDWEVHEFADTLYVPYVGLADNESEISIVYPTISFPTDGRLVFRTQHPRSSAGTEEIVAAATQLGSSPSMLAYDPASANWGMLVRSSNYQQVNYYLRTAPGLWQGPSVVLQRTGNDAAVEGVTLSFRESDGAARVLLRQKLDGDTTHYWSIFTAPSGSLAFTWVTTVASLDSAVSDLQSMAGAVRSDGEPLLALAHKLIADPLHDVEIFGSTAPNVWASVDVWDDALGEGLVTLTVDGADRPIVVVGESLDTQPNYGRTGIYYPW